MRTTVTLDPDVEALVRQHMHERRATFKDVVNDALRSGLRGAVAPAAFETPTFDMGAPKTDLTRALALAGALEDEERVHRMAGGR